MLHLRRSRMWLELCAALLCGLQSLRYCAATSIQGSIAKDPFDICQNPYLELQNLTLVELREYQKPENRWHAGTPELVQRIFKYRLLLPEALLQRGLSNMGDLTRLEHALQKLANGEAVTIVALGGSVSAGHGVQDPENGWIARVFSWIEDAFPDADHTLLNRAIPAVTSGYISACVPELVPENTDLVLLEFTYNDWVFGGGNRNINDASRRGLERLLRRLVAHPNRPGVLYVHYWPAAKFSPSFFNDEDLIDSLLKYYGIPTLSMRNALHGLLTQKPELLDQLWRPAPDPKIHPTCIGARMMADLVIGHVQHLTASLQALPAAASSPNLDSLADRQPFLLEGNWGHTHSTCVLEQDLPSFVTANDGWQWLDEGKTRLQHKWGFVSLTPESELQLRVPLDRVPGISVRTKQFLVGVGGLITYRHMGSMEVSCSGSCSCPKLHHNMFHSQVFSMTGWRYINVTRLGKGNCLVSIRNSPQSSTGEHKLKISSLMVSAKGEVVQGAAGGMLTQAMTDLGSAKIGNLTTETVQSTETKSRNGKLPDLNSAASSKAQSERTQDSGPASKSRVVGNEAGEIIKTPPPYERRIDGFVKLWNLD